MKRVWTNETTFWPDDFYNSNGKLAFSSINFINLEQTFIDERYNKTTTNVDLTNATKLSSLSGADIRRFKY